MGEYVREDLPWPPVASLICFNSYMYSVSDKVKNTAFEKGVRGSSLTTEFGNRISKV